MHRGWLDINKDGILEKDGRDLEIRMLVDDRSDLYKKIASILRQQFAEVGIKLKLFLYHDEDDLSKEYIEKNRIQAWLRFFDGFYRDPLTLLSSLHLPENKFSDGWNYSNNDVNSLLKEIAAKNEKKFMVNGFREIHKIIYEDQPVCFLFFPVGYHAISREFKNVDEYFTRDMPLYTIKDWHIDDN